MFSIDLAWMAHSLLRDGGWGVMMGIEAHFDESGTGADELTLAGYLFEAARIGEFCSRWSGVLREYDLPYFHMVECAHGKTAPYDKYTKTERIRLQMAMMNLIKRYSISGIVCNVSNIHDDFGQAYRNAAKRAARLVIEWANTTGCTGKIGYFFESGASGSGLTDGWFNEVANDPVSAAFYRYAGHAFVPKHSNPGVQAADLLAWQYHNFTKKRGENNLARLDLRALLRHPHCYLDECGKPPRPSKWQSVTNSRARLECVYYLPTASKAQVETGSVLSLEKDFVPVVGDDTGKMLACPKCFRVVCEHSID